MTTLDKLRAMTARNKKRIERRNAREQIRNKRKAIDEIKFAISRAAHNGQYSTEVKFDIDKIRHTETEIIDYFESMGLKINITNHYYYEIASVYIHWQEEE